MVVYETKDTALASYLLATGKTLEGITGPKGSRVFKFNGVSQADTLAYFQGQLVSAIRLMESYRMLKGLLFAGA